MHRASHGANPHRRSCKRSIQLIAAPPFCSPLRTHGAQPQALRSTYASWWFQKCTDALCTRASAPQVSAIRCSTKASDVNDVPYSCASMAFDSLDDAKKNPSVSRLTLSNAAAFTPCVLNTSKPPGATASHSTLSQRDQVLRGRWLNSDNTNTNS